MKIYAFADESSAVFDEQIDAMKRNGLNGLEIRGVDGENVSDINVCEQQSKVFLLRATLFTKRNIAKSFNFYSNVIALSQGKLTQQGISFSNKAFFAASAFSRLL